MTLVNAKKVINRSGSFALQEKRTLKEVATHLDSGAGLAVGAATGITGGTGTIARTSVSTDGGIITTKIMLDLTGLSSSTTLVDIIGQGTDPAYLGQLTAADNGTIFSGWITCLETPAGGIADIDLYSAPETTGVFDANISTVTGTVIHAHAGNWSAALSTNAAMAAFPAANEFLYLAGGAAGTAAAYTAGQFLITFLGYDA
jgi:hypothetical protein